MAINKKKITEEFRLVYDIFKCRNGRLPNPDEIVDFFHERYSIESRVFVKEVRQCLADYMSHVDRGYSHNYNKLCDSEERLAKLLKVEKYKDGSGFNFSKYGRQLKK